MKNIALLLLASAAFLTGCSDSAQYVDSKGTDTIVSIDKVDIQDFSNAADALLQSLYDSPAFENAPRKPPVLALTRITNDTSTQFDTDLLSQKIFESITRSGKARVSTTIGLAGNAPDPLAKESKAAGEFASGQQPKNIIPDYTLIGKIIEVKTSAGRTKQVTYAFHLTLTEVNTGVASWFGSKEITKQGSKSAVGW